MMKNRGDHAAADLQRLKDNLRNIAEKVNALHRVAVESGLLSAPGVSNRTRRGLLPVIVHNGGKTEALIVFHGHHMWRADKHADAFEKIGARNGLAVYEVRDFENCWYGRGVFGMADNMGDLAAALGQALHSDRSAPRAAMGFSSGAYAALVVGTLMNVKSVIAFAPQMKIDSETVNAYSRGNPYTPQAFLHDKERSVYPDVIEFLSSAKQLPRIHIVAGENCRRDMDIAAKIDAAAPDRVTIHRVDGCSDHFVMKHLAQAGRFNEFIDRILKDG